MATSLTADTPAELAELVQHAARRLRRDSADALGALGVTWAQARALGVLVHAAGPLRMAELAARLEVVPRSATDLVDALADAGLVVRSSDPADRRSVLVAASDTGSALFDRLRAARRASAETVFAGLSGAQRMQLRTLLEALCASGRCPTCTPGGAR